MRCPRDTQPLRSHQVDAYISVQVCHTCGGVWVQDGDLRRIAARLEQKAAAGVQLPKLDDTASLAPTLADEQRLESPLSCPSGHGLMKRRQYAGNSNVWMDVCRTCSGYWFDGGELYAVTELWKPSYSEDALVRAMAAYGHDKTEEDKDTQEFVSLIVHTTLVPVRGLYPLLQLMVRMVVADMSREAKGSEDQA